MAGYGRGVPSAWQGIYRASQQKKTKTNRCNRDSKWASQLERRPAPRIGGCLHFLDRPRCCCYASVNTTHLPSPDPTVSRLSCCSLFTSSARRVATFYFSLMSQRFMYCPAASSTRLNLMPDFFASSVRCFSSMGKLNYDRSRSRQPILPSSVPQTPLAWVISRHP